MTLGDIRQKILEAFEKQTGKKATEAWPTSGNCWTVVCEDGEWYNARVCAEVAL